MLREEIRRQSTSIELIPSENCVSEAVMEAMGSVLTNKYAEGYPGKRYYGGCEFVDVAERLAIDRAKTIFGADHANVQPHSGTQANMAVYMLRLQPGDTVLGMNLAHGGHLTHGHPLNFSGKTYNFIAYGVTKETETIDYDELDRLAKEHKPKMVVVGASAYPRIIDFPRMAKIAQSVSALLFVDMAHIAGLVAAGMHPSPVPHADFVSTTTHKTLRGPRGGLILCREKFANDLDRIIPRDSGRAADAHHRGEGHLSAGSAAAGIPRLSASRSSQTPRRLAAGVMKRGLRVVSSGTDNHLFLIDVNSRGLTGSAAQPAFDRAGITINKNSIPFDPLPPMKAGGIRVGTPAVTTRGMREPEMDLIAGWIAEMLSNLGDAGVEQRIRGEVAELAAKFPLYVRRLEDAEAAMQAAHAGR